MSYITKKEEQLLLDIETYIFIALNFKRESFNDEEEFLKTWSNYQELWNLNERLQNERKALNERSKEGMRKYRTENPEKAREYARNYMKEYNKRRKEAK